MKYFLHKYKIQVKLRLTKIITSLALEKTFGYIKIIFSFKINICVWIVAHI